MIKARTPVLLVAKQSMDCLSSDATMKSRLGKDPKQGCKMVVCIDGHVVSKHCFDLCAHMAHPGDEVDCLHVANTERQRFDTVSSDVLLSTYKGECEKVASRHPNTHFQTVTVQSGKTGVRDTILTYADEMTTLGGAPHPTDLIVMGSRKLGDLTSMDSTLGSIVSNVSKRTEAHMMIVKFFA